MHSKKWGSGVASAGRIILRRLRRVAMRICGPERRPPVCRLLPILLVVTACGFPRPEAIRDDSGPVGCARNEDCSGTTPYCVDTACVACRASASCPAARPVCEMTSHECRSCVKDNECESGACDLVAGACVEQKLILYVSPRGSSAAACTFNAPCSLQRAAELTDDSRYYIVMTPGRYTSQDATRFSGKKKIFLLGIQSSIGISDTIGNYTLFTDCSLASIRNVDIEERAASTDIAAVLEASRCDLTIDNMHASTDRIPPILTADGNLTITHSEFTGVRLQAARLAMDSCVFHGDGPMITSSAEITNSVFDANSDQIAISFPTPSNGTQFSTRVTNNTFVSGAIYCEASAFGHHFSNNIFYKLSGVTTGSFCFYDYNLTSSTSGIPGTTNNIGDPQFRDFANKDFHLKPGSPAIDAANPTTLIARDFDGTPRPQGLRSDIGAFEYVP